jgi:glycosyltransferase involved in cell wall biosynthesis
MRIVHITNGGVRIPPRHGGGVEAYILIGSKRHVALGHSVLIVDRKYTAADPDTEELNGVKIVRLGARRWDLSPLSRLPGVGNLALVINGAIDQLSFALAARSYLNRMDWADVILVHTPIVGWVLAILGGSWKDKLIYVSHSARRFSHPRSLVDRVAVGLETELVRRFKKGMFSVERAKDEVAQATGLSRENIAVIPDNCAELQFFSPASADPQEIIDKYQLRGKLTVLFVGRIRENKGVDYLVRAAAQIVNTFGHRDARFLLVGPVEDFGAKKYEAHSRYVQKVRHLIDSRGLQEHVRLLGEVPVEELGELYAASQIFVLPSLFEASPKVVVEAMAFGKPVVTTRVGMLPQAVEDGYNGFLVRPRDVRQLTEKIRYLIEHPEERARMAANARKKAEEEFSWDKVAQRMIEAYDLLTRRRGEVAERS